VPPGKVIPDGSVVTGVPGKIVREVSEEDLALIRDTALQYQARARPYRERLAPKKKYASATPPRLWTRT
jgi:carbonic anhydrase/acetyltransferase-like protein (isoleucine patch superfamily)